MSWFYILIALVAMVMIAVVRLEKFGTLNRDISNKNKGEERRHFDGFPYQKKNYLLTLAERPFFEVLERIATRHDSRLFTKVRLEDLVFVSKGTRERWAYRNKIKSRHVDFVICDKKDIRPLIAIELNDSSHLQKTRMARDSFYEQLFAHIGLPLLEAPLRSSYDEAELESRIKQAISSVSG